MVEYLELLQINNWTRFQEILTEMEKKNVSQQKTVWSFLERILHLPFFFKILNYHWSRTDTIEKKAGDRGFYRLIFTFLLNCLGNFR